MKPNKQKRVPLSIIRLYKLASKFNSSDRFFDANQKPLELIMDYLQYIEDHKNDNL